MLKLLQLLVIVFIILLDLTGCASIHHEVDPAKKIELKGTGMALLIGDFKFNSQALITRRVLIQTLDDQSLLRFRLRDDYPQAILVTPGRHHVTALFKEKRWYAHAQLEFDAIAEKTYIIRSAVTHDMQGNGYRVSMWVENKETGEKVGGPVDRKPPTTP